MFDDEKKYYSGQNAHSGGTPQRGHSLIGGVPPKCGAASSGSYPPYSPHPWGCSEIIAKYKELADEADAALSQYVVELYDEEMTLIKPSPMPDAFIKEGPVLHAPADLAKSFDTLNAAITYNMFRTFGRG